jgi:hypothetical protein
VEQPEAAEMMKKKKDEKSRETEGPEAADCAVLTGAAVFPFDLADHPTAERGADNGADGVPAAFTVYVVNTTGHRIIGIEFLNGIETASPVVKALSGLAIAPQSEGSGNGRAGPYHVPAITPYYGRYYVGVKAFLGNGETAWTFETLRFGVKTGQAIEVNRYDIQPPPSPTVP